ncbi:type III glutamate--ammonia ligase [Methyloligella sp. 2.7D]|uniref:type III glutamate--ammonia ligase n=1 Tax=unclassified Methyloligella TaxID=2625955 RepID=UPI00157CFA50|nr:type III glutamate--ammonia ligase [Methyloligella sp. GL2]QKP76204.1 type III glutamate--ammonia ligase [Methyloligella sp. GL2]
MSDKSYPTKTDLEAAGVKFLAAAFSDMHGVSKAKMVPIHHYERMMEGSELFTGAALDGVPQEVSDEEVAAVPDPASAKILPWDPEVAWFASDLRCEGKPFEAGSRNILKRVLANAADRGLGMNLGIEAEFFVFEDKEGGGFGPIVKRPHLDKPCYDLSRLLDNFGWLEELVEAMEKLDWGLYSFDHEDGIGQVELDFSYFPVLEMADNFVFLRMMANEIARKHGAFATFMPKPFSERTGSGAHYNMSLYDLESGANLFAADDDPRGNNLSTLGYQFTAGVLRHLPAIIAVVAPTVNSYKRLVKQGSMSGFTWAPVFACYGNNNRTNALRIPLGGKRVELRAADSACNPYLGGAMVLAAGLEGIAEGLDPGEPNTDNMYLKSQAELDALGITTLPKTLEEALDAFEADPLSKAVFGDEMFASWLSFKRQEWLDYMNHVSDWEKKRYLKMF